VDKISFHEVRDFFAIHAGYPEKARAPSFALCHSIIPIAPDRLEIAKEVVARRFPLLLPQKYAGRQPGRAEWASRGGRLVGL